MREKCKLSQIVLKNCSDIIKCFKEANKGKRFNSMEKVWVVCFPFIGKMCQLNIKSWVFSSSLDIWVERAVWRHCCVAEGGIDMNFY